MKTHGTQDEAGLPCILQGVPERKAEAVDSPSRFPAELLHAAATLYYLEDATQAQIAKRLGTSRPTVSRLLSEARRQGIVRIEVLPPPALAGSSLARRLEVALGLHAVYLSTVPPGIAVGAALAPALGTALRAVGLQPGDILLVTSGRAVYEAAQSQLPRLEGIRLAPTIGGQHEPEPWYQTNEITRTIATRVGGSASFLYAPALPSAQLHRSLLRDPSIRKVVEMWDQGSAVVMGVGGPLLGRESLPQFFPRDAPGVREAVGDICSRLYDASGRPLKFPGSDRLMAIELESLRKIPHSIAVATGRSKVRSMVAAARAGYFNQLVTDEATAVLLLDEAAVTSQGESE